MRYCTRCVQPDTRPGIFFSDDGVCGACLWEDEKKNINWKQRENELRDIVEQAKSASKGAYECAIGVSGGKDSTFQALYARDVLGLRPLLVSCEPDDTTELGRHNIENLKRLGFDVISLRPNPLVMRKCVRRDFFSCLNPERVTEYPLWASTYIVALRFGIPLVIQGENPGQTLGTRQDTGTGGDALGILRHNTLKNDPFLTYVSSGVSEKDLFLYRFDAEEVRASGIRAVWLSYYAKEWSQPHNAAFSMARGLHIRPESTNPYSIGTYRLYFQLDAGMLEVGQLLKYIKFGFGQTTDHVGYDIREGLISRDEGVYLVKELDGCCGTDFIERFCRYIEISEREFWDHANTFRGDMWRKDVHGRWSIAEPIWEQCPPRQKYGVDEIMRRLNSALLR